MATFEAQVNGITNLGIDGTSTDPGQSELTQFLKDGVIDVTNRIVTLRPQDIENFQRESATIDSNSGLDVGGAKIISVIREAGADGSSDGSTAWEPCGKISASMQSKVVNIDSLHYASQYHPKYIIDDNGKVNVYPVASANNGYKVFFVNNVPTDETNEIALVYSHSDIKWFPNDKVYLVVIYAGIKSLQASLASASISTFSLTSVPPDIPTLSESSVTITGTAPTYTAPSLDASSDQITEMEAGTIGSAQTDTEQWFDIAGDFIEIEEDTELAAAQLQKISAYLQTYSAAMQNQLNIFNDANVEYQAKLQKNIKDADFDSQEIQTYQQELAEKSAEYQWKTARLQDLKQEYNQAFAIMVPPQAKQQQARQRAS